MKAVLIIFLVCFSACALVSNPENSGGEIVAIPAGPWCEFRLSPDGNWLSYIGDYYPGDASDHYQRRTVFVDLNTSEVYYPLPDSEVSELLSGGLGPDGNACFSEDNRTAYLSSSGIVPRTERESNPSDLQHEEGVSFSVPGYRIERNRFRIDLTSRPLHLRRTDTMNCAEAQTPKQPSVRIVQVRDNLIQIYNSENRRIAEHKPRGLINGGISMVELSRGSWHRYYAVSPDESWLAYQVFESGLLFASPTQGYMVNLQNGNARFLAASVFSFDWDASGNLYACTSHSGHNNVIARWQP